jgi:SOS response regulatory protein OraA/RecX
MYDVTDHEGFVWSFPARVVHEFGLYEGVSINLDDLMLAAVAGSMLMARLTLRKLLGKTRKPAGGYREILISRGLGQNDADLAVSLAMLVGVIDDLAWARDLVEIRFERRGEGAAAIRFWLQQRGFDRQTIQAALLHLESLGDPVEKAYDLLVKKFSPEDTSPGAHQKAWAFLARRGHSSATSRKALQRFYRKLDEEYW